MPTKPQGNDKAESADQKWKVRIEGTLTLIREGDSDGSETEHRDTVAHQSGDEEQRSPDVSRVRMLAKNVLGWLIANATFINALFAAAIFFATCQYKEVATVQIDVPDTLLNLVGSPEVAQVEAREAFVLNFVRKRQISHSKAAELLNVNLWELPKLLAKYEIPWFHYRKEDVEQDLKTLREREAKANSGT